MENDDLIARIEKFCTREDIAESTFGLRAVNDGKLMSRLREGGTVTMRTLRQIEACLRGEKASAA